jgi:transcription-repair coupling factor (superfamily II helicase)
VGRRVVSGRRYSRDVSLQALPPLLRHHPGVAGLAGSRSAVLAVPEPARAFTVAGLAHLSGRSPLVVAVPTTAEAERLAADLRAFLGVGHGSGDGPDEPVEVFPAWETLPFERVSPGVETMGRRLRVLWRLRAADEGRAPRVVIAPVRALVQRLGPHVEDVVEPLLVRAGDRLDPLVLVERLVAAGYRREFQVEHRGEVARRGSIVDVFPSTAEGPVRIDVWGDEVDRLTRFSVADQRSTADVESVELFPCRELLPTEEVRERASRLVAAEPWGREQWERLSEEIGRAHV